jgi:uncharacterized membrane protein (DUF373 family)
MTSVALMIMMGTVVVLSIIDLGYTTGRHIINPPFLLIDVDELSDILGLFLWILIALELLDSVRTCLKERALHIETVLSVSVIAVARKVIVVHVREYEPLTVIGIAAIIDALCFGYYLIRKCHPHPLRGR